MTYVLAILRRVRCSKHDSNSPPYTESGVGFMTIRTTISVCKQHLSVCVYIVKHSTTLSDQFNACNVTNTCV